MRKYGLLLSISLTGYALVANNNKDLLFSVSYKKSITAEKAAPGTNKPVSGSGRIVPDKVTGGALDAGRKGFRPLRYKQKGNILSDTGTIEFKYKPQLPNHPKGAKGTVFAGMFFAKAGGPRYQGLGIGLNLKPDNKQYIWAIIKSPVKGEKTTQFYKSAKLKNNQWYKFAFCWKKQKIAFYLDGKLLGILPRPKAILASKYITIGGQNSANTARGLIADVKIYKNFKYSTEALPREFADCVKILFPEKRGKVLLKLHPRHKISATRFGIIVNSKVPCALEISSDKFNIIPGATYAVNYSDRPPLYLTAKNKGITIPLSRKRNYSNILISKVDGKDLLQGVAWHGKANSVNLPTLAWGHEGVSPDGSIGGKSTGICGKFKREKQALMLEKLVRDGEVKFESSRVPVKPGQEYLFAGWYHVKQANFGATALFRIYLSGQGQKDKLYRAIYMNPLIVPSGDKKRRYIQVRFKVPNGYNKARAMVALRGAKQQIWWERLTLHQAPLKLTSLGKDLSVKDRAPVISMHSVRKIWKKRPARSVRIATQKGLSRLLVDGKPVPLLVYNHYVVPPAYSESKRLGEAGIKWQFIRMHHYLKHWWNGRGKYDFSEVKKNIETTLSLNPDAIIMLNVTISPRYKAWGDEYPKAVWRDHSGRKTAGYKSSIHYPKKLKDKGGRWNFWAHSYSAQGFRDSSGEALKALAKYLKSFDCGKAVAGIQFNCGTDNQWFPHVKYKGFDFSTGAQEDFRYYLRDIYSNDVKKLQAAWGDSKVTFENAALAPFASRSPAGTYFLSPQKGRDRRVIDSNRYNDIGTMKSADHLGGVFKKAMGRNVYVSLYAPDIIQGYSGRSARKLLLEKNNIDGFIGVPDYGLWRSPGRTGNYSCTTGSLALHGKIFLSELDYRTQMSYLAVDAFERLVYVMGGATDEAKFANQARRDLGMLSAQGAGAWFLAMNRNSFNSPEYLPVIHELVRAMKLAANKPMPQDRGQICVFLDEDTRNVASYKHGPGFNNLSIGMPRLALFRSGLSWDPYFLSDLTNPQRHKYRIYLFLASPAISAKQITWVQKNLQKDGNVLIFVNVAGISSDKGSFEQNIKKLTGMTVKYDKSQVKIFRIRPTQSKDPLARGLKDNVLTEMLQPLVYVDDPKAIKVGEIADTGKTGWAVKRFKDWTSVYIALPGAITPELIRNIAAEAKLTPIGPCNDMTTSGNGFITLHAISDGSKTIRWNGGKLRDLISGKIINTRDNTLTMEMKAGQTRWFRKIK
jgi:Concanavalin A-like lectin/glucanases superfamily